VHQCVPVTVTVNHQIAVFVIQGMLEANAKFPCVMVNDPMTPQCAVLMERVCYPILVIVNPGIMDNNAKHGIVTIPCTI